MLFKPVISNLLLAQAVSFRNKKAVLPQGNRAMPQVFLPCDAL